MVTNGHVIHIMGHATQALGVCASQEVCANQGLKHSSLLGGALRKDVRGGRGGVVGRRMQEGKIHLGQSTKALLAPMSSLKIIKVRTSRMIGKGPKGAWK